MIRGSIKTLNRRTQEWSCGYWSYLQITHCGCDNQIIEMKGNCADILGGIDEVIGRILANVSDDDAQIIREWLKSLIREDEERRFQEAEE